MTHLRTTGTTYSGEPIVVVTGHTARRIHAALTALDIIESDGFIEAYEDDNARRTDTAEWRGSTTGGHSLVAALLEHAIPSEREIDGEAGNE